MRWIVCALMTTGCVWVCSSSELFDGPWPDERWRNTDGTVDAAHFPEGTGSPLRDIMVGMLEGADGFGRASAIYFPMEGAIDESTLPTPAESLDPRASVFLIDIDPASPFLGRRAPIDARFAEDAGPYGARDLLSALPYPGIPLAASTTYAAIVTTRVHFADGRPLAAIRTEHATLASLDVDLDTIAAIAIFRTGDPLARLRDAIEVAPSIQPGALEHVEDHDAYCVLETTVRMPVLQRGTPPYLLDGGGFGDPIEVQREETARMFVTVPRGVERPPAAIFVRTGGGGDRPLIDHGARDREGTIALGSGLARDLAEAGFAGVMVDGPLGGVRNTAEWDEQFVVMNTVNLPALEGNVLQSALELVLVLRALGGLSLDACGARAIDTDHVALIGHSMGAQIAPIAAAVEPGFGAVILSGAGASWIRQVMFKESPVRARDAAELMLGYPLHGRELNEHDPILSLLEWSGERSDPALYAGSIDADVLVFQGVRDTYIPPPIANPMGVSLHVSLEGPALDATILDDLALTASDPSHVLVQYEEDGIEDGHEILFQREDARVRLRSFLVRFANE
jgi:pimeloyl-ACP methyl ester carboxylesterase